MSWSTITYNAHLSTVWAAFVQDRAWVEETVAHPDALTELSTGGGRFVVLTRRLAKSGPLDLLVIGKPLGDSLEIWLALPAPARLRDLLGEPDPLRMLEAFAAKFGEPVRVGSRVANFFTDQRLAYPEGSDVDLVRCDAVDAAAVFAPFQIVGAGDARSVVIAFAFSLSLERYRAWLGIENECGDDVEYSIAEPLRGQFDARSLCSYAGLATMGMTFSKPIDVSLFGIRCDGYELHGGIRDGALYLTRNGVTASAPLAQVWSPEGELAFRLEWTFGHVAVVAFNPRSGERTFEKVPTSPTRPPNRLQEWARRRAVAPTTIYRTPGELYETVSETIQSLNDRIATASMQSAFWDRARGAARTGL